MALTRGQPALLIPREEWGMIVNSSGSFLFGLTQGK
jgi:hypothetical protein